MAQPPRPLSSQDILNGAYDADQKILRVWLVQREDLQALIHPFAAGTMSTAGTSWTAAFVGTVSGGFQQVAAATLLASGTGTITELNAAVTIRINSSATADTLQAKVQGRNLGGTWADISAAETVPGTTVVVERTFSGLVNSGSLTQVPFEVRVVMQSGTTDTGTASVKNSSFVLVKYNSATG